MGEIIVYVGSLGEFYGGGGFWIGFWVFGG